MANFKERNGNNPHAQHAVSQAVHRTAKGNEPTVYASVGKLAERFDASETSIWRWTREGDFPKPVKLTNGMTRWRMSDVIAWETKGAEDSGQTIPAE